MHCEMDKPRWLPGKWMLTMSEVDLPPTADRVLPVIVRGDSVVMAIESCGGSADAAFAH